MSDIPAGVKVESVFLVEAQYAPDAAEKRPAVRAEHLARVARLREEGVIIEAGAYSDELTSSLLLVRTADAEAALAVAREDVYVRAGVWADISARPFGRVTSA
ncbi:MAG: YciI family protein [Candidatus Limnocylindrales bacterium]